MVDTTIAAVTAARVVFDKTFVENNPVKVDRRGARRVKVTNTDGDVIRETGTDELLATLLDRNNIESELAVGAARKLAACAVCGLPVFGNRGKKLTCGSCSGAIPGLSLITHGKRAGRFQLGFRYDCPTDGKRKRISKLYPSGAEKDAVFEDARRLIRQATCGGATRARGMSIAQLAPKVVALRAERGGAKQTISEFRIIVTGVERAGRELKGGHIVRHLGKLEPCQVGDNELSKLAECLVASGLSPFTVRNVFKVLVEFFRIVRQHKLDGRLKWNPADTFVGDGLLRERILAANVSPRKGEIG